MGVHMVRVGRSSVSHVPECCEREVRYAMGPGAVGSKTSDFRVYGRTIDKATHFSPLVHIEYPRCNVPDSEGKTCLGTKHGRELSWAMVEHREGSVT